MAVNKEEFYQKYVESIRAAYPDTGTVMSRVPCYDYDDFMVLTSGLEFDSEIKGLYESYEGSEIDIKHQYDGETFIIRDENKSMHLGRSIYDHYYNHKPGGFRMFEKTDDGFYQFNFGLYDIVGNDHLEFKGTNSCTIRYVPNYRLESVARKYDLSVEEIKDKMLLGIGYSIGYDQIEFKRADVKKDDMFMFFNSVYKNGIAKYYREGELRFTDEDRIAFEEQAEALKNDEFVSEVSERNMKDLSLTEKRNFLASLVEAGIELTDEQQNTFNLLNKLEEYKSRFAEREERQREARERVSAENAEKEAWWNDPENPSNKREEQVNSLLETADKHVILLDAFEKTGMKGMLSEQQLNELEKSKEFSRMMNEVSSNGNSSEYGMDTGVREWYQEHYGGLESGGKGK